MKYPSWICADCGQNAQPNQRRWNTVATFHAGDKCDVCGEEKPVTEPRDYGWPTPEQIKLAKQLSRSKSKQKSL